MQMGFFDLGEVPKDSKTRAAKRGSSAVGCEACSCDSSKALKTLGRGKKSIMIVLEQPAKSDFVEGEYLCSTLGDVLIDELKAAGISAIQDCYITSAVTCPGSATLKEVENCRVHLQAEIKRLQPKLIIPVGYLAVAAVVAHRLSGRIKKVKYEDFYGEQIPDRELDTWVAPTFNLAHCLTKYDSHNLVIFRKHLRSALECLNRDFPNIDADIKYTRDADRAIAWIDEARISATELAFDYETTGIKPHKSGHAIVTASFAYRTDDAVIARAFWYDAGNEELVSAWKKLMLSKRVGKIAHKADFEMSWTYVRSGAKIYPQNFIWDTCLAAHCYHNQKTTSLKFETFTKLGILGFDDKVDEYITQLRPGEKKGTNAINRIYECPKDSLLFYNAQDSLFTLFLYEQQRANFDKDPELYKGAKLLLEGSQELCRAHEAGLRIDLSKMVETRAEIARLTDEAKEEIMRSFEYSYYRNQFGKSLNPNSSVQLKELFTKLKIELPSDSVDETALAAVGSDFTKAVLKLRKAEKILSFVEGYEDEAVDGIIHPFYNLHKVKTFRSSSDSPNFQNIPKRDKVAKRIIRNLFRPSPGNRFIEYDYKAVEVCISACYHKDKNMISYITDPSSDMHRDTAKDAFIRKDDWTKDERQAAKNGFVFPAFYGSSAKPQKGETIGSITKGVWDQLSQDTFEHLKTKNIHDITDFQKHIEQVEKVFWEVRFRDYYQWRISMMQECKRDGHYYTHTGFKVQMPMSFTEGTNAPIQGSAFHCLLFDLIKASPEIRKFTTRSRFIGQIHDALIADVHPDDEEQFDEIVKRVGTELIREAFEWICVPLTIEKERSAVDGTWADMESCGVL